MRARLAGCDLWQGWPRNLYLNENRIRRSRRTRTGRHSWQFDDAPKTQSAALPGYPQHCSRNSSAGAAGPEAVQSEHEADHCPGIAFEAVTRSSILIGEALERIHLVVGGLRLNPQRMRSNLDLSGGMISGEAIMLELGKTIGRQHAHDVIYKAASRGISKLTFSRSPGSRSPCHGASEPERD